ncbi:lactotransferrin precursor [Camelus dromedarius]|uniref:lactotransferrin precursor n=1 Tax=Camelus dromedarius TaxID=9838 RepID=UPI000016C208|nr:lactotransferrin precursor [Camelus dromedarius]AAF82241.1 lactoferrin [Camelus dromedarius]
MKLFFPALLSLGALGLCLAASKKSVRWCTTSPAESSKCAQWQRRMKKVRGPSVTCVKKTSRFECIQAISTEKADAVTLDGGLVYDAGLDPYKLRPIAAEVYGTENNPQTHYYAVAIAKKGTNFQLNQLQGLKSCHTGLGRSAGWNIPMGLLRPFLDWTGPPEPLQKAVAKFFSASCVPCVDGKEYPNLCQLCAGTGENKCACSSQEPYFGYSGAFKCLQDGAGDVAFVKDSTVFESLPAKADRDQYELLCPNNTRKPVDASQECHLARVPSHAVVARSVNGKEDLIWKLLVKAQEKFGRGKPSAFQLFGSPAGQKDLLFKDSALGLLRIPSKIDSGLYLGSNYITAIRGLRETAAEVELRRAQVVWCAVGSDEQLKCQEWSRQSNQSVVCATASTTEDCIALVLKGEADALSLDGGYIYIAGKCGLVPVLAESQQSPESSGLDCVHRPVKGYLAVAVVRKANDKITWNSLRGKKSCHTAVDRTAGWNIPMGPLFKNTDSCRFDEFFSQSCAPGSDPRSKLCALCAGNEEGQNKCVPNSSERYYGYTGAFRCLAENVGDVAFVKDVTVLDNTDGKNTEQWAKDLKLGDFELLCLNGTRKPVTEAESCHLPVAPNHAVVSRIDKVAHLEQVLLRQQAHFGRNGQDCPGKFCLFQSKTKNLLFNDNTECLAKLQGKTTYEEYLGPQYVTAIAKLRRCSTSPLLEACAFLMR